MNRICLFVLMTSALGFSNLKATKIDLGLSMIYFPTARLDYLYSSNASYQLVDNILLQTEITYVLGYGFRAGAIAGLYKKGSNPGYPKNGWLLRHGFGFLNVSYPGLEPVTLEPGKPLVLKYRVILFSGDAPD